MAHDATAQEQGAGATAAAGAATGAKVPGAKAAAAGGDQKRKKYKRRGCARLQPRRVATQKRTRDMDAVALLDLVPKARGAAFMVIDV